MSTAKSRAIKLRDDFRIKVSESIGEDGETINNYLSSKETAKKAALICIRKMIEVAHDLTIDELLATERALQKI